MTIGANPSRQEFLSTNKVKSKIDRISGDELKYLNKKHRRFYHLNSESELNNLVHDISLRKKVITSFNEYFYPSKNPYQKWFGKPTKDKNSYNVEGFLNGLGGSYYYSNAKYTALHCDLIPFATVSDFTSIKPLLIKHFFRNNWAQSFLGKLISMFSPELIIIFGRTNYDFFSRYCSVKLIEKNEFEYEKENGKKSKSKIWMSEYRTVKVVGLSVNLGNPIGFNKSSLNSLGEYVRKNLNLIN